MAYWRVKDILTTLSSYDFSHQRLTTYRAIKVDVPYSGWGGRIRGVFPFPFGYSCFYRYYYHYYSVILSLSLSLSLSFSLSHTHTHTHKHTHTASHAQIHTYIYIYICIHILRGKTLVRKKQPWKYLWIRVWEYIGLIACIRVYMLIHIHTHRINADR